MGGNAAAAAAKVNMGWSIPTKLGRDAVKVGEGEHHMSACCTHLQSASVLLL